MFPTKILLAVDGSPGSEHAARAATRLANSLASKLHVVLVGRRVPISGLVSGSPPLDADYELWARESIERNARERLEDQLEKIQAGGGEIAAAHVRTGRADVEIVALAEELGAGLVVVGSRGLGRLKRAVMGSVSRNVVRHAHCPVLVVHDGRSVPISGPILAADDGSREATEAIGAGAEISAATGGAGLHVVHVIDPDPYMPYPGPEAWDGWQEHLERDARGARSWVEKRAEGLRDAGAVKTVEAHLVIGNPGREISRLADELDAGIVILGSRGLGGVRRMLLGSVSDFLVGHAPCSVMVVRQDETGDGTEG